MVKSAKYEMMDLMLAQKKTHYITARMSS